MSTPDVRVDRKLWDELLARAAKLDRCFVRVGVLESKGGGDVHDPDDPLTLVDIATIHEFGTETIPERSFIRYTFYVRVAQELVEMQTKLAKAIVTQGLDPMKALNLLGMWAAAEVKKTITEEDIPPPNAESTIAAKGSSKPLVNTGLLKNAISYEVVEGDDSGPSVSEMPRAK